MERRVIKVTNSVNFHRFISQGFKINFVFLIPVPVNVEKNDFLNNFSCLFGIFTMPAVQFFFTLVAYLLLAFNPVIKSFPIFMSCDVLHQSVTGAGHLVDDQVQTFRLAVCNICVNSRFFKIIQAE